jgi:hypothetical protein
VAQDEAAPAKAKQHHHYKVKVLGTSAICGV